MASDIVNIPICTIPEVLQRNCVADFMQFVKMKALEGRWLQGEWCPKLLARMTRRGWLKLHEGKYYQVGWETAFPLDDRYTHAKISVEVLDDPKLFKAMLFVFGYAYLMSPQAQRGCYPRRKRTRLQVNESKHMGGVSHTVCMLFFGMSKSWCAKMRKICSALGLGRWTRRWIPVRADGPDGELPDTVTDQMLQGPGRYKFDKNGQLVEEITSKFKCLIDPKFHIPYEYRRETYQRYA